MERSDTRGRAASVVIVSTLALLLGIYFVYPVRVIVLVLLLTLLFSAIFGAPVDYLSRRGVPRLWGTLAVALGLLAALPLGVLAVSPLVGQAQRLAEGFPVLLAEAQDFVERLPGGFGAGLGALLDPDRLLGALRGLGFSVGTVLDLGSGAANALSLGIVVVLTGVFAVSKPAPLVRGFVALFPAEGRERAREILAELYGTVQRWFLGQLADMVIVGALSAVALWIIGVPFALLLGLISGLLGFVPYIGFAVSLVPPVLLDLADDPVKALWVVLAYVLIQQLEQDLIYPLVMSRAVSLHPASVVFGLFVSGLLFGFPGLLLAVPLMAAVQVLVRELWITRMDQTGVDPYPPLEAEKAPRRENRLLRRVMAALGRR